MIEECNSKNYNLKLENSHGWLWYSCLFKYYICLGFELYAFLTINAFAHTTFLYCNSSRGYMNTWVRQKYIVYEGKQLTRSVFVEDDIFLS